LGGGSIKPCMAAIISVVEKTTLNGYFIIQALSICSAVLTQSINNLFTSPYFLIFKVNKQSILEGNFSLSKRGLRIWLEKP
jgi:hypothetical protein